MPKAGDRIVVEGTKVGGGRREGTLVGTVGSLLKVRWDDGAESIMAPGAGAVRFEAGRAKASAPAKKASATPAKAKQTQKKKR